jgi:hypothetical protein
MVQPDVPPRRYIALHNAATRRTRPPIPPPRPLRRERACAILRSRPSVMTALSFGAQTCVRNCSSRPPCSAAATATSHEPRLTSALRRRPVARRRTVSLSKPRTERKQGLAHTYIVRVHSIHGEQASRRGKGGTTRLHPLQLVQEHVRAMLGHVQAEEHNQTPQELAVARWRQLLKPVPTQQPQPVASNSTHSTEDGADQLTVPARRWSARGGTQETWRAGRGR